MTRGASAVLWLLAAGTAVHVVVPGAAADVLYGFVSVGAVLTGAYGLAHHRPAHLRGWAFLLAGFGGWVVGDVLWWLDPAPGSALPAADVVYLTSYAVLAAGLLSMLHTRRDGAGAATFLDASIVTVGAGVLVAVFLVAPVTGDAGVSLADKVIATAYPLGDLLLMAIAARMWASPGGRTPSYRLLVAALVMVLLADVAWNVTTVTGLSTAESRWTDAGWLLGYVLAGAAACHPSMRQVADPVVRDPDPGASTLRLLSLGAGLMLPGATLLVDGRDGTVLWPVIGGGSLLLSGLVVARLIGLFRTVRRQTAQLQRVARSDALTGAPNRRSWDHELERACDRARADGRPLTVALIDLDRFKTFNDQHGHQAGDDLLREAVAAWTAALDASELIDGSAMLARYGGEEFALLLPDTTSITAARVVNGLRAVVPRGQTLSAGVATWCPDTEPRVAVAHADLALYAAKNAGRDRVVRYDAMVDGDVPYDVPSMSVVVQPIVGLATGEVLGHEALSRFPGDGRDVAQVFRLAHSRGSGDLLEAAALRSALRLPGRPAGQHLFVNVSADALASARFWAQVPERLDGVVVELTEDVTAVGDAAGLSRALDEMRARGARIALDDVGAGLAELARLVTLRPDVVKVDRSLVHGCSGHPARSAVLRALVAYAAHLGVAVCAEGVEDPEDLAHVRRLGIAYGQGFLLGQPEVHWHGEGSVAMAGLT